MSLWGALWTKIIDERKGVKLFKFWTGLEKKLWLLLLCCTNPVFSSCSERHRILSFLYLFLSHPFSPYLFPSLSSYYSLSPSVPPSLSPTDPLTHPQMECQMLMPNSFRCIDRNCFIELSRESMIECTVYEASYQVFMRLLCSTSQGLPRDWRHGNLQLGFQNVLFVLAWVWSTIRILVISTFALHNERLTNLSNNRLALQEKNLNNKSNQAQAS